MMVVRLEGAAYLVFRPLAEEVAYQLVEVVLRRRVALLTREVFVQNASCFTSIVNLFDVDRDQA
jgi:hypothetical protein